MAIFSKLFGDLMSHIIRKYADEETKYFLNVSLLKIMDLLLSLCQVSTLLFKFKQITTLGVQLNFIAAPRND